MNNYVITIGRQAGSGGSILGRNLAKHFGFHYIDKDLIKKAAEELNVPEEELARMDEKESIADRLLLQTGGY
ncbi:cytidylate kinase-like family protein, partial [Pseudomonas aeruginosa]|nr:cytidylate kinase-like family protein [Pseudomonas aeruginosa]